MTSNLILPVGTPWGDNTPEPAKCRCHNKGCLNDAHLALRLCVPPLAGKEIEPLRMIVGVALCVEHFGKIDASDIARFCAIPEIRHHFDQAFRVFLAIPSYSRAYIEGVNLHNPEWRKFVERAKRNRVWKR